MPCNLAAVRIVRIDVDMKEVLNEAGFNILNLALPNLLPGATAVLDARNKQIYVRYQGGTITISAEGISSSDVDKRVLEQFKTFVPRWIGRWVQEGIKHVAETKWGAQVSWDTNGNLKVRV